MNLRGEFGPSDTELSEELIHLKERAIFFVLKLVFRNRPSSAAPVKH
jgi:hypothetical protein